MLSTRFASLVETGRWRALMCARSVTLVAAGALIASTVGGGGALLGAPASAANNQAVCYTPLLSLTAAQGYVQVPNSTVAIYDGTTPRFIVATFSADANVMPYAEMRATLTVDGASPADYTYGTGNLAENQQYDGVRTLTNELLLGPGTHTITA